MKRGVLLASLLLSACAPALNLGSDAQPLRGTGSLSPQGLPYAQVTAQTPPDTQVILPGCTNASFRLGDVRALGENGPALACERLNQYSARTASVLIPMSFVAGSVFFYYFLKIFGLT